MGAHGIADSSGLRERDEPEHRRAAFSKRLQDLLSGSETAVCGRLSSGRCRAAVPACVPEKTNRALLQQYGALAPVDGALVRPAEAPAQECECGGMIRIGIVSQYFWKHSSGTRS